jgi:hypothetical protein
MEGIHGQLPGEQAGRVHAVQPADLQRAGCLHRATADADDHRDPDAHDIGTVDARIQYACLPQPFGDTHGRYADTHDAYPDPDTHPDHVLSDTHPITAPKVTGADGVAQNHVRGCLGDARGTG